MTDHPTDYLVTRGREHDQTHRLPGYQGPRTWPDPQTTWLPGTENMTRSTDYHATRNRE